MICDTLYLRDDVRNMMMGWHGVGLLGYGLQCDFDIPFVEKHEGEGLEEDAEAVVVKAIAMVQW